MSVGGENRVKTSEMEEMPSAQAYPTWLCPKQLPSSFEETNPHIGFALGIRSEPRCRGARATAVLLSRPWPCSASVRIS